MLVVIEIVKYFYDANYAQYYNYRAKKSELDLATKVKFADFQFQFALQYLYCCLLFLS